MVGGPWHPGQLWREREREREVYMCVVSYQPETHRDSVSKQTNKKVEILRYMCTFLVMCFEAGSHYSTRLVWSNSVDWLASDSQRLAASAFWALGLKVYVCPVSSYTHVTVALFTVVRLLDARPQMDREWDVAFTHNGILFGSQAERSIYREVSRARDLQVKQVRQTQMMLPLFVHIWM